MFNDELEFEKAFVNLLFTSCGWDKNVIKNPTEEDLIKNWANILFENNKERDILNNCPLTENEMHQIMTQVNTLKTPLKLNGFINGKTVSITRDNPDDQLHFNKKVSLKIYDRMEIAGGKSRYQIVEQPRFKTDNSVYPTRRGDVMLLINGMPVIHIELKKSGVAVSQATTQIEKYMHNNVFTGIFSLIQIFVAMSPEETLYFANPGYNGKFNSDFYFHWEDFNNNIINDWRDFTTRVLSIPMAHEMVGFYTIADNSDGILKVMRSYQYYAASAIADRVAKTNWTKSEQHGGYIWHTTGSGKTMTSFKAAQLISNSNDADKVIFLIDRVDIGKQSLTNYRDFADVTEEVQATEDTSVLMAKLKSNAVDDKLIVTSIQKMSRIREDANLKLSDLEIIRNKRLVFIVDECHRSQAGKMHQDIKDTFPNAIYFGFTGTPDQDYTADIFGDELHRYTIYHGIRDKNVLGFDPYMVLTFDDKDLRQEVALNKCHCKTVEEALSNENTKDVFLYYMDKGKDSCSMIEIEKEVPTSQYEQLKHKMSVVSDILDNWLVRSVGNKFHAILATSRIKEAIEYYNLLKASNSSLKITAIFEPSDDNSDLSIEKMDGITNILNDYKEMFGLEFQVGNYNKFKEDVCLRLAHKDPYLNIEKDKSQELDIVIVVNQLLTGFDSKWINTLYLDKWIEGKNLIQAISRTNRLYGKDKPHGTIIWYRYPHTMELNLKNAVRDYSGTVPIGLFVNKLDKNIEGMNSKFYEIKELFNSVNISNFEKNYDDVNWQRKFGKLFSEFNKYLDSAKIQGFRWNKLSYVITDENDNEKYVLLDIDERTYLILVQRYKDLFKKGRTLIPDIPFDIDTKITEIQTDSIDDEYINSKFEIVLKEINIGNKDSIDRALNELHKSFASLNQQEQKFAKLFLHDLESGSIIIDKNKTFRDYLTDYQFNSYNDQIKQMASGVGVDETKLRKLMELNLTENNINDFGRYDDLINTLDINKAKDYYESKLNKSLSLRETKLIVDQELRDFILNGGFYKKEVE